MGHLERVSTLPIYGMPAVYDIGIGEKMVFRTFNGTDLGTVARSMYLIATRLRAGRPGVRVQAGSKDSTLLKTCRPSPGPTQAHI
jgi:hypothetical protein